MSKRTRTPADLVGRMPESLDLSEQLLLHNHWIALELYTPETLPLRAIAAVGNTVDECASQLTESGKNAAQHEYWLYEAPRI
jgi:hypothetical protein